MKQLSIRQVVLAAALAVGASASQAATFECIVGTVGDCALATSSITWTWDGSLFTVTNGGSGYVSEVYFDLGSGMAASFASGTGTVLFTAGASPGSLPAGASVGFVSDASFDSDGGKGPPVNGINNGESASFTITGALLGSFDAGDIAAGLHVRSLTTDGVSLVTTTVTAVPEPETYALMLAGLGVIGWLARRRAA